MQNFNILLCGSADLSADPLAAKPAQAESAAATVSHSILVGSKWRLMTRDPFEKKPIIFEVVDIKDGYVQYKSLNGNLLWSESTDRFVSGLVPLAQ